VDRLLASIVAAPFIFATCSYFTRAPARRTAAALAGGAAFAVGNIGWDVLAGHMRWWWYPGFEAGHGPLVWYAAVCLSAGGVGLVGWRARRRFGARGAIAFLILFAVFVPLRDQHAAASAGAPIVFGPGSIPWIADATAAFTLMSLCLAIQLGLGGPLSRLRSQPGTDQR
jgi:hypothetical protein